MPELRIHHIALNCDDPSAVERYYTAHFGFTRVRVLDGGDDSQVVFLRGGGILLELFRAAQANPLRPAESDGFQWSGVRNFSFEVDNVDAKLAQMGRAAIVTFGPINFDAIIPGWRSAWLRDPAGNIIQITQGYQDQGNPPPFPPA